MRTTLLILVTCFAMAGWATGSFQTESTGTRVTVQIAPHTLQLGADQGGWVVVHAEIKYSLVNKSSVRLQGVPAGYTKADSRGELVAGFSERVIKGLVAPPRTKLTLRGLTTQGTKFGGSDTVTVTKFSGK